MPMPSTVLTPPKRALVRKQGLQHDQLCFPVTPSWSPCNMCRHAVKAALRLSLLAEFRVHFIRLAAPSRSTSKYDAKPEAVRDLEFVDLSGASSKRRAGPFSKTYIMAHRQSGGYKEEPGVGADHRIEGVLAVCGIHAQPYVPSPNEMGRHQRPPPTAETMEGTAWQFASPSRSGLMSSVEGPGVFEVWLSPVPSRVSRRQCLAKGQEAGREGQGRHSQTKPTDAWVTDEPYGHPRLSVQCRWSRREAAGVPQRWPFMGVRSSHLTQPLGSTRLQPSPRQPVQSGQPNLNSLLLWPRLRVIGRRARPYGATSLSLPPQLPTPFAWSASRRFFPRGAAACRVLAPRTLIPVLGQRRGWWLPGGARGDSRTG
ncbi:hypothetical protein BP6252_11803 [Coleophoma cylindrospora]|uniref:Uncharacterized protein n=1 Tax=Coleophoma cylindrospora TaxID=1849047 RepID=A0A3D8QL30_9HELO|nr:hypothetical protein BP6252_11803 [Coleophoma cylindrospora]